MDTLSETPQQTADNVIGQKRGIQVISRAAAILRALEKNSDGMSLSEISKAVALPRSTVQRIVDALDQENLVLTSASAGEIRLGPAILALAVATRFSAAEIVRPVLLALAEQLGEMVVLAILDKDKVVYIDMVPGRHRLGVQAPVGLSLPLHCSATGKALLAALDDENLSRIKKRIRLTRYTGKSKTDWAALDEELATIRQSGVAFDRDEYADGISAVSAAIRPNGGELAIISVAAPTQRFMANETTIVEALKEACASFSAGLNRQRRR